MTRQPWRALLLLVLPLISLSPASALAWNEPEGFRDIPWGTPWTVVVEKLYDPQGWMHRFSCDTQNHRSCSGQLTIGSARASAMIHFGTGEIGMDEIYLTFPADDFALMKAAFVEKYGDPTSRETPIVQNRNGGAIRERDVDVAGGEDFHPTEEVSGHAHHEQRHPPDGRALSSGGRAVPTES